MQWTTRILSTAVFVGLTACTTAPSRTPAVDTKAFEPILNGTHRSAENRGRDRYRHPQETLAFFGIAPDMTVVEVWPGNGWFTEILAPLLRDRGTLYAAHVDPAGGEYARTTVEAFRAKLNARPDLYSKVIVTTLAPPAAKPANTPASPAASVSQIAPPASADMVVTFRNMHNWMMFGWQREAFEAMYAALKPGGVLGVVEHRGDPGVPQDLRAASGYVNEKFATELIESVGFKLVGRSDINANSRDTKNYEKGVWALPPNYAGGENDRQRVEAIGESDRFTLKFVKPASGTASNAR